MRNQLSRSLLYSVASLFLLTGVASAHHPTIEAQAVCDEALGGVVIVYTSTAWEGFDGTPRSRENPQIDILINGVVVDSGAYADPNYSFSGTVDAPLGAVEGDQVAVTALAVGTWGTPKAGGESASVSVTIPADDCGSQEGTGRFTGGGHQLRVDGVRVTRGLTIHCDLLLSNNLEINWQGNRFHMTEHLTTTECSDDPNITQAPPDAPLDTLRGVGEGRYNNAYGYTIDFTLVDAGEPGRDDKMAMHVYETANPANTVLFVPLQFIDGGNLQAHYDQPHK